MRAGVDQSTPVSDRFSLDTIIQGLALDLESLRGGRITTAEALARAELAKQIMNGVRLFVTTQQFLERKAKQIPAPEALA